MAPILSARSTKWTRNLTNPHELTPLTYDLRPPIPDLRCVVNCEVVPTVHQTQARRIVIKTGAGCGRKKTAVGRIDLNAARINTYLPGIPCYYPESIPTA